MGAAAVLLFRQVSQKLLNLFLGFGAGVMLAASIWSLLLPAIEGSGGWLLPTLGVSCGAAFLLLTDWWMDSRPWEKAPASRWSLLLILAVTLHNIPEGMAIGVAFGGGVGPGPWMLALGIGLQNFPEGAAVSLPLRQDGFSRGRSFLYGQASGLVEPIAGIAGVLAARYLAPLLPFFLSFAAGSMLAVVAGELMPEAPPQQRRRSVIGLLAGFLLMMVLDVALG